ncbi:hypothetical protein [Kamptonema sp. UHCC 0994]|uniref:hypothetical protein n=1 Tax=Kamptonema sp. UHCC 0994 TaxID=3031329 RepID=UPI0023BA5B83|nr:hypothetical protein [Kamptonema sp. UHCC 0994]MDF0556216.1 hypothetical protein [Kamptonema sp. UHCC 0994]
MMQSDHDCLSSFGGAGLYHALVGAITLGRRTQPWSAVGTDRYPRFNSLFKEW